MKKMIMSVMVVLISSLLFYVSALATTIGDLEENLRITTGGGCVRPILIFSDNDKVNIYITGEMIKSAAILSREKQRMYMHSKEPDLLYIEGELYFDFKDEKVRKNIVEKIKEMIRVHEENVKLNQETGKDIPYPESVDSYFYGSFVGGNYDWARASGISEKETIENFRFLTMRITVTLPFSQDNSYDAAQSNLDINRRCFHSGKPLKMCNDGKLYTGIVAPVFSMSANGNAGQILLNVRPDQHVLGNLNTKQRSTLQNVINNIILYMIKTNKSVPVR